MKTEDKKKSFGTGKGERGKTKQPMGKKDAKPWEKMNGSKKPVSKPAGAQTKKTSVKEYKSFLYLLPKKTGAGALAKVLDFLPKGDLEIWEDEIVLEITTANGTITFEDIRDSLGKEDEKVLSELRMKQVLACDYEAGDSEQVRKVMEAFLAAFGGRMGSDTEDFQPFMELGEV